MQFNVDKVNVEDTMRFDDDTQRLEQAWQWLCSSRQSAPDNADIWDLRFHWTSIKTGMLQALQRGEYVLSPLQVVGKKRQAMWSAQDALALKWCALAIEGELPLHPLCEHVKGHGGGTTSLRKRHVDIVEQGYRWVCRTDIKGYYQHINKAVLFAQLQQHITRPAYLNLLKQYLYYSLESGEEFYTPTRGIVRGCALSPLMGAFHLWALDHHFAGQKKITYARYMDDFILMAKTRWSLRKQVKRLNQFFTAYGFSQHPDKTSIGRVEKGFDWLGGQYGETGLMGVSARAVSNHVERCRRLYEQAGGMSDRERHARVDRYRQRWTMWSRRFLRVAAKGIASLATILCVLTPAYGVVTFTDKGPAVTSAFRRASVPVGDTSTFLCANQYNLNGVVPSGNCPWTIPFWQSGITFLSYSTGTTNAISTVYGPAVSWERDIYVDSTGKLTEAWPAANKIDTICTFTYSTTSDGRVTDDLSQKRGPAGVCSQAIKKYGPTPQLASTGKYKIWLLTPQPLPTSNRTPTYIPRYASNVRVTTSPVDIGAWYFNDLSGSVRVLDVQYTSKVSCSVTGSFNHNFGGVSNRVGSIDPLSVTPYRGTFSVSCPVDTESFITAADIKWRLSTNSPIVNGKSGFTDGNAMLAWIAVTKNGTKSTCITPGTASGGPYVWNATGTGLYLPNLDKTGTNTWGQSLQFDLCPGDAPVVSPGTYTFSGSIEVEWP